MTLNEYSGSTRRRRRGAELEAALLDAAWAELVRVGYESLTYEAVAERARTSRAVLYRRWPTKRDLALATVLRVLSVEPTPPSDTGSLRGDVIALLHAANDARARIAVQLAARLDGPEGDAPTLGELRDAIARRRGDGMGVVLERARARGEIAADLPRSVRAVPFEVLGYRVLTSRRAATPEEIAEVVDEVFLPLVRAAAT